MDATSPRWRQITPSQYAWEADAFETLRALLPDADPFQAWANFEFTDGGAIREADCLVVTPKGVFLIEVKSWSGQVTGDQGQWVQIRNDGSRLSTSNPAAVNTGKARSLASLIKRNWAHAPNLPYPPYIESLVWFSNPKVRIKLPPELRSQVAVHDDNGGHGLQTITDAILTIGEAQSKDPNWRRITPAQSEQLVATMGRIGFREALRKRTVGSYELELPAFAERGRTQDFLATHELTKLPARVRVFSNVVDMDRQEATNLKDAAHREFLATKDLPIEGVIKATELNQTEYGPAVVFDHPANAIRLDRFMAERGDELDLASSLRLLERLATTVREIHKRRITHRMLTPESVWLVPARKRPADAADRATDSSALEWEPLVSDLSLAAREQGTVATSVTTYALGARLPVARTGAVEVVLGDPAAETYLAPEHFTDPDPDGVALDVFSLGAIAHLLITGKPPAQNRTELRQALGAGGLSLAASMPGIHSEVDDLVRRATSPVVSDRYQRASELTAAIAVALAAVTGDRSAVAVDPLVAEPGDVLADRFTVKQRLGKGSTATALWCEDRRFEREVVLKVSLGGSCDDRIRAEAEALANLKQQNVVELLELLEVHGRPTLVLSFAGERSLGVYLREEGAASTEYLRRWGEDLLEAIRYLERVGVAHRDVKPDNLGIVELGARRQPHLVLFDFSLSSAPAADVGAGTPPYLEPFLESQGRRFDLAAERYAAAVTLHEMATGETPTWGDGHTDPSYLPEGVEASLLVEAMDPRSAHR